MKLNILSINFVFVIRAIPESDYVTLGTIRYGVKLSHECIPSKCEHLPKCNDVNLSTISLPANKRPTSNSHDSKWPNKIDNTCKNDDKSLHQRVQVSSTVLCDTDSSSDVNSVNGSCCLNAKKCSLPWNRPLANRMEKQQKINVSCE